MSSRRKEKGTDHSDYNKNNEDLNEKELILKEKLKQKYRDREERVNSDEKTNKHKRKKDKHKLDSVSSGSNVEDRKKSKKDRHDSHKRKHSHVKSEELDDSHRKRYRHTDSPPRHSSHRDSRHKEFPKDESSKKPEKKEEPNFSLSGKLTEYTNTYNGVVIKYNEPQEARKPKTRWRLYPFKGQESLAMLQLHRQSAFLFGRDRKIADIPIDHPSCSKQQAILQFRLVQYDRTDGTVGKRVRPYIIDLESTNGTFINNNKIEPRRYVEILEKDVLKFGFSSRDYVLLHEKSKDDEPSEEDEGEEVKKEKKSNNE